MLTTLLLVSFAHAADPGPTVDATMSDPTYRIVGLHSWRGGVIARARPQVEGVPVIGSDVTLSLSPTLQVRRVRGEVTRPWPAVLPTLSADDAVNAVGLTALAPRWLWSPRATLAIQASGPDSPRLIWALDVGISEPLGTWRMHVDAHSGDELAVVPTSRSVQGDIFPTNPEVSDLQREDLLRLWDPSALSGQWPHVTSCVDAEIDPSPFGVTLCHATEQQATPNQDGDFLFNVQPESHEDPFAEVQVYYHLDRVAQWSSDQLGVTLVEPIDSFANFEYNNAFYGDFDGDGTADITFGTAENGVDLAYDADVIYHEFGHAIVDRIASLGFVSGDEYGLQWTDGSINEGTADIIAMYHTGDPLLGEYAGLGFRDGPIRDLTEIRRCPDDLIGEVHFDGMIWASLGWQMMEDPLIGPDLALELVIASAATWTAPMDWPGAGTSLRESADDLLTLGAIDQPTHDAVIGHLDTSGVESCGRSIPAAEGESYTFYLYNYGLGDVLSSVPGGHQLEIDLADPGLEIEVEGWDSSAPGMGYAIYLRADGPVAHDERGVDALGLGTAYPVTFDHVIEGDELRTSVIGDDVFEELASAETVFLSVASTNLDLDLFDVQTGRLQIRVNTVDIHTESEVPAGCGCHVPPSPMRLPWALLVGSLPWLALRRKNVSFP